MTKRNHHPWLAAFGFTLMVVLTACQSFGKEETFGYGMGGIDHLADNLSVSDFWVNGAAGFQAGDGNAGVSAPLLPAKWHPGLTVHVVWDVRDWEHDKGSRHEADVPVNHYPEDGGDLWVHFLADGTVRAVVSDLGPRAPNYPGPHEPIPRKRPWDMYPPRMDWRDMSERRADIASSKQTCSVTPDPTACAKQVREILLDEQRADARRYLPRCGPMTGQDYEECEEQARESMRAARLARRCQVAPELPECNTLKAGQIRRKAATGPSDQ